jgi:hypothetical protein
LPSTIAATACPNVRPNTSTASTPTKIVANSMLGEVHVQNSWRGLPWRSASATRSLPPGSTATILSP